MGRAGQCQVDASKWTGSHREPGRRGLAGARRRKKRHSREAGLGESERASERARTPSSHSRFPFAGKFPPVARSRPPFRTPRTPHAAPSVDRRTCVLLKGYSASCRALPAPAALPETEAASASAGRIPPLMGGAPPAPRAPPIARSRPRIGRAVSLSTHFEVLQPHKLTRKPP